MGSTKCRGASRVLNGTLKYRKLLKFHWRYSNGWEEKLVMNSETVRVLKNAIFTLFKMIF
jgi:hypothetical protein